MTSGRITPARIWVAPFSEASMRSEQIKRALCHRQLAETFGDNQGDADILVARDSYTEGLAQKLVKYRSINAADHYSDCSYLAGLL